MRCIVEKIVKYSNYGLFCWYFLSIFITYFDQTLSHNLKLLGEGINLLTLSVLVRVIVQDYSSPKFLEFSIPVILIGWYGYYTKFDASNSGYPTFLNFFYTTIDLLTLMFLIDSTINFLRETIFGKIMESKINNLQRCVRAFLIGLLIFLYAKCIRMN